MSKIRANRWETLDGVGAGVIYVDTVADLQALDTSDFPAGQQVSVAEAGIFVWSGSSWAPKGAEKITVRVPSDYPDWQEAFDAVASLPHNGGVGGAEIVIESGHVLQSGLYVGAGDYSHITITSEDSQVEISEPFSGATSQTSAPGNDRPRCAVIDASKSPVFDILVNGENYREQAPSGSDYQFVLLGGVAVFQGGTLFVNRNKGFVNFSGQGLYCREAKVVARGADFHGSGRHGAQITGGSQFEISDGDFYDSTWNNSGPSVNQTSASVTISRGSVGNAQGVDASRAGRTGIDARRSVVSLEGAVSKDCDGPGLTARNGSIIFARGVDLGEDGVIMLRNEGGGIIFLGNNSTYGLIRNNLSSDPLSENTNTSWGAVYNSDIPVVVGDEFEGYIVYADKHAEMWKSFTLNESGDFDFDNMREEFPAPIRLQSQHPDHSSFSGSSITVSGVTFRLAGQNISNDLMRIAANTIASYSPGLQGENNGAWTLRHPFSGVQTPNELKGVLWARGKILNP